jgi:hypothetical protein
MEAGEASSYRTIRGDIRDVIESAASADTRHTAPKVSRVDADLPGAHTSGSAVECRDASMAHGVDPCVPGAIAEYPQAP